MKIEHVYLRTVKTNELGEVRQRLIKEGLIYNQEISQCAHCPGAGILVFQSEDRWVNVHYSVESKEYVEPFIILADAYGCPKHFSGNASPCSCREVDDFSRHVNIVYQGRYDEKRVDAARQEYYS